MIDSEVLQIHMLGEFSLTYQGKTINDQSSRSKKLWVLLEYLITFRDKEISQSDLIDLLWPEVEITNPANTLKTLLHRARSAVADLGFSGGKDLVVSRRGTYAWNTNIPIWLDTDAFDELCRKAALCDDPADKLAMLLDAIELYRGDFLPKSSLEDWAVPIAAYYHAQFIKICHEALAMLQDFHRYDDIISICQRAVVIDPYDEAFHHALILALTRTGNHQGAMQHYDYVTNLFFNQFGVTPSEELTALYREIVNTDNAVQMDLNIIKESLAETDDTPGAFFCEYGFFKDIYQLNVRSCARNGQAIQLVLLTLFDRNGNPMEKKALNVNMDRLRECVGNCLRRGDVFTRYSLCQFLLMLPSASYENGEMVINRIIRTYRRLYPKADASVHYKILPLEPEY